MKKANVSIDINFVLITLIFIVLKLTGVVNWGWLWVLSPLWLPIVISLCFVVILLLVGLVAYLIEKM